MPESEERSNASASWVVGLAAAVIIALGVGVLVYNRQPPAQPPAPLPSAAESGVRPSDTPATPAAEASASPESQPSAAPEAGSAPSPRAAAGTSSGTARPSARDAGAAAPSGKAKPEPGPGQKTPAAAPSRAPAATAPPLTPQAMLKRGFVGGRTASENVRGISKNLSGFDSRKATEVKVKRAPEVDARIEFSTTPVRVKGGDKYSLRVSLINEGKRSIEVQEIEVRTTQNRKESSTTVKPLVKQVAARQNEVIHEIAGTWDKNTTSFSIDVRVMSSRLDLYQNKLVWK